MSVFFAKKTAKHPQHRSSSSLMLFILNFYRFYSLIFIFISALSSVALVTVLKCYADDVVAPKRTKASCISLLRDVIRQEDRLIKAEVDTLNRQIALLDAEKWLPKAPQLRGRIDRYSSTNGDIRLRPRVGLRWTLPSLSRGDRLPVELTQAGITNLANVWRRSKEAETLSNIAERHITLRKAWLTWALAESQNHIKDEELKRAKVLYEAGALQLSDLRQVEMKRELAFLGAQEEKALFYRVRAELLSSSDAVSPISLAHSPLRDFCIQDLDSIDPLTKDQSRLPSPQELSIMARLMISEKASTIHGSRWLEFIEVSYDEDDAERRVIAELGVDLPWGERDQEEAQVKSSRYRSELTQTQRELQRYEKGLRAMIKERKPSLRKLQDLKLQPPGNEIGEKSNLRELEMSNSLWAAHWESILKFESVLVALAKRYPKILRLD